MEIKVKNTKGGEKTFTLPQSQNISDLKLLIQVEFSIPVSSQKLIYKGRILDDARTLSDYSIKSQDTIILTSTPGSSQSSSNPSVQPVSRPLVSSSEPLPPPSSLRPVSNFPSLNQANPSNQAYRSTSGNLSESSPAPSNLSNEENKSRPVNPAPRRSGTFDFLMGNANFEQIVKIIREDPRSFEDFITQLKTINPELHELINNHKKEFVELIRGRDAESDQVQLTREEFNEVKELMALGFSAQDSLEAYLGCGKNKELAASLLFSNNH